MVTLNVFTDAIRELMFSLCSAVYSLMVFCFNVFEVMGTAEIMKSSQIQEIFRRISLVLGIFMVFRLTFAFIQYIMDPDTMLDKKKGAGNLVIKVIIMIVLLGSTSTLFGLAYRVQNIIVDEGIIAKIVFGNTTDKTVNYGSTLSAEAFTAFYTLRDETNISPTSKNTTDYLYCNTLLSDQANGIRNQIKNSNGSITVAHYCLLKEAEYLNANNAYEDEYIVQFDGNGLIPLLVGVFLLYTIFMFTVQLGVRAIQLAYLQIIAPIPIAMYITPKGDETLKKWGTQCLVTFLDFFIRTAIIYFAVELIDIILKENVIENALNAGNPATTGLLSSLYVKIVMIIAILTFAKKVPELLKELFPGLKSAANLSYDLSAKKMIDNTLGNGQVLRRGYGAIAAGAGTIQRNMRKNIGKAWDTFHDPKATNKDKAKWLARATVGSVFSGFGGVRRGLMTTNSAGRKSAVKNAVESTQARQKMHDTMQTSGYKLKDQAVDQVRGFFGKDQKIGDIVSVSDLAVQQKEQELIKLQQEYNGNVTIQASKVNKGQYIVMQGGEIQKNTDGTIKYYDETSAENLDREAFEIATKSQDLAKEKSKNKALHQKENEQSQKKNG